MIFEDEAIAGLETERVLKEQGWDATAVITRGDEMVKEILRGNPDLVISDIHFGGYRDGVDIVKRLRLVKPDIPVIYVTAYGDREIRAKAALTAPKAFITKPFLDVELVDAVRTALL